MKKITLSLCTLFLSCAIWAQNTTGTVSLSRDLGYSATIEIGPTLVRLDLVGPDDGYLALGFGVTNMINNGDCIIYTEDETGPRLIDSSFNGNTSTPSMDAQQDWTIVTNSVVTNTDGTNTVRRLTATRALDTGNADDYVFTEDMESITLVWAHRSGSFDLGYHGSTNRGAATTGITLSTPQFNDTPTLSIYPNPTSDLINVNIGNLSDNEINLDVYSVLGKKVYSKVLYETSSVINTSQLGSGVYVVKLSSPTGNIKIAKQFIKL